MQEVFFSILPIFLITMLGSIIRREWLTADEFWRGLEKLSYFLLFPVVLFNYISTADLSSSSLIRLVIGLICSSLIAAAGLVIHQQRHDISPAQFTSIFQGALRYNSYIFFAIADALYSTSGLGIAAVISAYMIIFTNAISVIAFNSYIKQNPGIETNMLDSMLSLLHKFSTNPLIIASILGFIFNYLALDMNIGIKKTFNTLSDSALAIGVLNVGAGLKYKLDGNAISKIGLTALVKLFLLPVITFIVLTILAIPSAEKSVGVLYSSLPCASTAYILSKQLGGDADLMASIITITTILSLLSIPLVIHLMA